MNTFIALLLLVSSAPEFPPTVIEVDLNAAFPLSSEEMIEGKETDFMEIYPGIARVLHEAGVTIVTPQQDGERFLLERDDIPTIPKPNSPAVARFEFSSPRIADAIYRVHISIRHPDGSWNAIPAMTCGPPCLGVHVEPFLREHKAQILSVLKGSETPPTPAGASKAFGAPQHSTPRPTSSSKTAPIGPLGIAGIIAGGTGLGMAAGGGISFLMDRTSDWEPESFMDQRRPQFSNQATNAVFWTGVGLVGAGIIFVLVDQLVLKKRDKRTRNASVMVTPLGAVGWERRF